MSYYRAGTLTRQVAALDRRWPKRDRRTDGWIADKPHQERTSDHNPDWSAGGVVRAEDTDHDGIHRPTVIASLLLHESTQYVIYRDKIWHRRRDFKPARYTGTYHGGHLHRSVRHGRRYEESTALYELISTTPNWSTGLRKSPRIKHSFRVLQAYLNAYGAALVIDGNFGDLTDKALRAFQRKHNLKVDGIAGPKTLAKLRTA